jgi:hypothetical protein
MAQRYSREGTVRTAPRIFAVTSAMPGVRTASTEMPATATFPSTRPVALS